MNEPSTIVDLLDRAAAARAAAPALSTRDGLRTAVWSYSDLRQAVRRLAGHLRHGRHLEPGARVIVLAPNGPRTVAAHLGAMQAGLIPVPLDTGSSPEFVARVIAKTEASLMITAGRSWGGDPPRLDLATLHLAQCPAYEGAGPAAEDIAEIVFTSGTTGDPKGTILSHRNVITDVHAASTIVPAGMPIDLLSILPLSHMLEQTVGLYLPMLLGGSVHYLQALQPPLIIREMRRRRVTGMVVVPRFLAMLLTAIERNVAERGAEAGWKRMRQLAHHVPIDFRRMLFPRLHRQLGGRLRYFLCGGAALPRELAEAWESLGVRVLEGYGSTECAPVIASNTYHDRCPGSIGRPVPGVAVKLSAEGELLVRGPNVTRGYWRDDQRTSAAFTPDGWFKTGDVAVANAEGRLTVTARLGDRIVLSSGQKVFPADIEDELRREREVVDCVVVALPDSAGKDKLHAALRLADGAAEEMAADVVRRVNGRLASHQRLTGNTVWKAGDFPRTSLGKVKRGEVLAALRGIAPAAAPDRSRPAAGQTTLTAILQAVAHDAGQTVTPDCDLAADLGVDSLGRVELAARIESEMGINLDEEALSRVATVRELENLLASSRGKGAAPEFADWPLSPAAGVARTVLQSLILLPLSRLFLRPFRTTGGERLRDISGPVLLIANHTSHADTVAILRTLPARLRRRTAIAAASDYFYRYRFVGLATSLVLNTFAFSRSGNIRASLERCGELADAGWSVLIYPEGSRSADGTFGAFKQGIGLLAKGLHVAVIPLAVQGAQNVLPKGKAAPRAAPVAVRVGEAITVGGEAAVADLTTLLHDAVAKLLQESDGDAP